MTGLFSSIIGVIASLVLLFSSAGCTGPGSNPDDEYLIRVGDRVLTVREFNQAFEIAKTAYPYSLRYEADDSRNAKLRLLNELTVEMIILKRAEELGLYISEEEVEKAVADIKSDYPEGTFEKTLLEFAVSYETWRARLKNRLLMQKVIDSELKKQIVITPEDIAAYYEKNFKAPGAHRDPPTKMEDINEMIIKQLRRQKAEQAYKTWIIKLKQQYAIEINSIQWEKMLGSHYGKGENFGMFNSAKE